MEDILPSLPTLPVSITNSIEAARAGKHGKGFAVVADEVKKLAEGVTNSVIDITGIVTGIQQETGNVTEALENGYREVEEGTNQIIVSGETFNDISTAVKEVVNNIQTVTDNLSDITIESQEMNRSIQEIAAAGLEQTSASSQQTSSAMEEVSASSSDLLNWQRN